MTMSRSNSFTYLGNNQNAVFIGYVNIDIRFSTLFFIAAKISGAEGKTEKKAIKNDDAPDSII